MAVTVGGWKVWITIVLQKEEPAYDGLSFEEISSEAVLNWVYFRNCEFFVDADLKVP